MMRQRAVATHAPSFIRLLLICIGLFAIVGAAWAKADSVHAFLDRNQAQMGDTVTLNVKVDGTSQVDAPDLGALAQDFDVLGTSRNTSISIINGNSTQSVLWAVSLRPKRVGTLTIPPLDVAGQATDALTLTVTAAPATAQGGPGDDVFVQASLDTDTPYVGQQVNLTVRLYYAPNLTDGNLDQPQANGVHVQALGAGTRYQVERSGRRYHVLEQHYAMVPERAGSITLPPLQFRGSALDAGGFPAFMGSGRVVTARSRALTMHVRTRPPGAAKGRWLPARAMTLTLEGLPTDGHVQVGEPLTLTLTEEATGLAAEALPEPQLPTLEGVQVYPDRSNDHTGNDGQWLQGIRTRKFAIVPQHAGPLQIPAITLTWWNVVSDQQETATVPAHTMTVMAGAAAANAPAVSASTAANPARAAGAAGSMASKPDGLRWRGIALVSLGLWVLTALLLLAWAWHRRHRPGPAPEPAAMPGRRQLRSAFMQAARADDVHAQATTLLAWARAERPSLRTLGELKNALDSTIQSTAIAALERARFAHAADAPASGQLVDAFSRGFQWRRAPDNAVIQHVPPLYPRRD